MHLGQITEAVVEGVRIESLAATPPAKADEIVFVHGGMHGSWCFEHFLPFFARRGWAGHALNWYGHNGSKAMSADVAARRSLTDVVNEVAIACATLRRPPILVAHSMGGLVAQKYVESHDVRALVLLAPVLPASVKADPIPLQVEEGHMFAPPPFEMTRHMFFDGLDEEASRIYFDKLCPESSQCVLEATRFTVDVDTARIACPILVIGATEDQLCPAPAVRALAELYRATYHQQDGRGHNLLLEPRWEETASLISDWLDGLGEVA